MPCRQSASQFSPNAFFELKNWNIYIANEREKETERSTEARYMRLLMILWPLYWSTFTRTQWNSIFYSLQDWKLFITCVKPKIISQSYWFKWCQSECHSFSRSHRFEPITSEHKKTWFNAFNEIIAVSNIFISADKLTAWLEHFNTSFCSRDFHGLFHRKIRAAFYVGFEIKTKIKYWMEFPDQSKHLIPNFVEKVINILCRSIE